MSEYEEDKVMEREEGLKACNAVNELRFEKKLCDVLIKADGAEFYAHKNILCGCSRYFSTLFTNGWYPSDKLEYTIPDISSEIMQMIIDYAYTQPVNITEENVCELLKAADYLGMSDLVNKCSAFLKAQLCVENCIGIWQFAHCHFCQKLRQYAFQFILYNFVEIVCVSDEFLRLTAEQLIEIIENDELNVKQENVVFEAILQWIEHEPQHRKEHMSELLPKVRLALLGHEYLIDNVKNNAFVPDNESCTSVILSALKIIFDPNSTESHSTKLMQPRIPSAILLAISGWSGRRPTNAIEAYDTRAKCWISLTCNDEAARAYHGAVFLKGFVYCIGGFNGDTYFSSVRRFDPISKAWAQVAPMHSCRCYVSACVLDGHIYAMGGYDGHERLNTAEIYEPESNQWSMIASMHATRSDASATVLYNSKVYICGGFDGNECLSTAEYYTPQTDQWTMIPRMNSRRSGLGVIAYEGQVYAVGGFNGNNRLRSAEVYNPQTNTWSHIPNMINQRSNFGIEVVDDLLFVVGGYNGYTTTQKAECYDKKIDKWSPLKDTSILRSALSCCILSGLPNMAEYAATQDKGPEDSESSSSDLELSASSEM